jgi:hypothetical protein
VVGMTISHCEINEKLGEDGMRVVHRAVDAELDRTLALRFLSPHLLEGAKAAVALNHPGIIHISKVLDFSLAKVTAGPALTISMTQAGGGSGE